MPQSVHNAPLLDDSSLPKTLGAVLQRHAAQRPDTPALIFEDQVLNYGALDRRADQVAGGLRAFGLAPGARIAVLAKNQPAFFELLFAAARAGYVLVPVNYRLAGPEVAYVVNDAQATLLFVDAAFAPLIETLLPQMPMLQQVVALDGGHASWLDYRSWRDAATSDQAPPAADPGAVVLQMYTSGTTGHPKGAQLSHGNFLTLLPGALREFGKWHADDVSLVCMPLFHIAGAGWGLVGLYLGIPNVLMREVDPAAILALIPRYRVTKTLFVPAVILFLLDAAAKQPVDFSSLDLVAYGASPIPLELLRRAIAVFGCGFVQLYGLTETTGAITVLPAEDHADPTGERLKSCGRPMQGVDLRIVDGEGKPLPAGGIGEVICRTPQLMRGYWHLPEANAQAIRGGWFFTGDAGYLDADGYLYIYDRVKDMIVSGGENIYPAEVESALFGHPAVADVAVIGVPDRKWGEAVKAVVVRRPGASVSEAELIAHARQQIAGYKLPKSVDFVDALPRNPTGKLLKRELRKTYWADQQRQVN